MKKKHLTIYIVIFIFTACLFGLYQKYKISQNPIELKSYAIWTCDNEWIGRNCWEYIHLYNNKYFIRRVANTSGQVGSVDIIEVNKFDLNNSITKYTSKKIETNKMIFFGEKFPFKDSICFYGNGKFLKSLVIQSQFGVILELYEKTRVEIYREKKLFSVYNFKLIKNKKYNFYPLEIKSPNEKFEKKIIFNEIGEFKTTKTTMSG